MNNVLNYKMAEEQILEKNIRLSPLLLDTEGLFI